MSINETITKNTFDQNSQVKFESFRTGRKEQAKVLFNNKWEGRFVKHFTVAIIIRSFWKQP